jgi:calcineurin-like phosphoesterase family protein
MERVMSKVYLVGDFHFNHNNILKYRPQFKTIEEHNQTIIDNFNKTIKKRDTVYFMGDIVFADEGMEILKKLRYCHKKILILGNHCFQHFKGDKFEAFKYFDEVVGSVKKKGCWLSHIPIHPDELRGSYCIHAHTHNCNLEDPRYFNTSLENIDYTPIDLMEVIKILKERNPEYEKIRQQRFEDIKSGKYKKDLENKINSNS